MFFPYSNNTLSSFEGWWLLCFSSVVLVTSCILERNRGYVGNCSSLVLQQMNCTQNTEQKKNETVRLHRLKEVYSTSSLSSSSTQTTFLRFTWGLSYGAGYYLCTVVNDFVLIKPPRYLIWLLCILKGFNISKSMTLLLHTIQFSLRWFCNWIILKFVS